MALSDQAIRLYGQPIRGQPGTHTLQARILGPVELVVDGRPLPLEIWHRRSARSLLLVLLATPGHRIARERAIELLWPNLPADRVQHTWYQALSSLRQILQPDLPPRHPSAFLSVDAATIRLRSHVELSVDVDVFEHSLRSKRDCPLDEQRARLRAALDIYRGDLLDEEPGVEWAQPRRTELHLAWQRAVVELAGLDLHSGQPLASMAAMRAVIDADRTAESVHRALIVAHLAAGEREKAFGQYERCRAALLEDLGVEPDDRTRQLIDIGQPRLHRTLRIPLNETAPVPRPPLPAPATDLIGRDTEVATIEDLLWRPDVRLVTLTGPAGIGKTRLALEVAREFERDERDVAFISLAGIRSPDFVLSTIAQALHVRAISGESPFTALVRQLGDSPLLLVIDTFEHVLPAASTVSRLMAACPALRILCTSRTPLHIHGEHAVAVPPLSLPGAHSPSFAALSRSEAVTLFARRAVAAKSDFVLSEKNAPTIARLCARLDALPLAIELAAARVRIMSPRALLSRIDQRLDLLADGPHDAPARLRTMRGAINWSYDLLNEREQTALRRLSVCPGGISLPAAGWLLADERVENEDAVELPSCCITGPPVVPEALISLVDHSLLRQEDQDDGEPRFVMLETVRDFAWEQLHESGEAGIMQRRHAAFMLAFARASAPSLTRTAQTAEVDELALEINNIRAALAWTLDHEEGAQALRLATAVIQLWFVRGMPAEGRRWLERALAVTSDTLDRARVDALLCAASLAFLQEDLDAQTAFARGAAVLSRALGYRFGIALAYFQLGLAAEGQHELERASWRYEKALALMLTLDEPYWIALLLSNLGEIRLLQGWLDEAEKLASEGLARWRACSNEWGLAQGLGTMAAIAAERGDAAGAATHYLEALDRSRSLEDRRGLAGAVAGLAGLATTPGQAARLLGAAQAMGDAAGVRLMAHHLQFERVLAATRARLEGPVFDREWTIGHFLTLPQANAEAEELARTIISSPSPPVAAEGRSRRSLR